MKKKWIIGLGLVGSMVSAIAVPNDLIDKLSNENYQTRTKAYDDLKQWASKASKTDLNALKEEKNKAVSPETRMRIDLVIDTVVFHGIPNTRGFIGISMEPVIGGVLISQIHKNTAAAKSGLKVGDKIIKIDKLDLSKMELHNATMALSNYVKGKLAGERLKVNYMRNGKTQTLELKLSDYNKFMKKKSQQGVPQGFQQLNIRPGAGGVQLRPFLNKPPQAQDRAADLRMQIEALKHIQEQQGDDVRKQQAFAQILERLEAQLKAEQEKQEKKLPKKKK